MMTENGSVKTKSTEVAPALDLYRKKLKLICLIMLIIGSIGLVAYVALGTVWENKWLNVLLVFAVPFTLGLIGFITVVRLAKREAREEVSSECEFFADCAIFKTYTKQGEIIDKIAYSDAVLKRENESYGYIFVFSKGLFFVFSKDDLEISELNAIYKNLRKQVDGDVAELKNYKDETDNHA